MRVSERLLSATQIFLDTAPVVYYVEEDERYLSRVDAVFNQLDSGQYKAVVSPVTLAECLVMPYRREQIELRQAFISVILNPGNVWFIPIDQLLSNQAAELRARYNLALPDAFQAAAAILTGCDAFLTNDATFKRVKELIVIVLDDCDPE